MSESVERLAQLAITLRAKDLVVEVRELRPSEELDLMMTMGPQAALNYRVIQMARAAAAVKTINGVPVPVPNSLEKVKAILDRLGARGVRLVGEHLSKQDEAEEGEDLKNFPDTPSPSA
jgi:hypothetical protein